MPERPRGRQIKSNWPKTSPSPERDHVRRKSAAAGTPRVDAVGRNPGAGDGDCLGVVRPVADVEDFLAGRPGSGLRMPASLA